MTQGSRGGPSIEGTRNKQPFWAPGALPLGMPGRLSRSTVRNCSAGEGEPGYESTKSSLSLVEGCAVNNVSLTVLTFCPGQSSLKARKHSQANLSCRGTVYSG